MQNLGSAVTIVIREKIEKERKKIKEKKGQHSNTTS